MYSYLFKYYIRFKNALGKIVGIHLTHVQWDARLEVVMTTESVWTWSHFIYKLWTYECWPASFYIEPPSLFEDGCPRGGYGGVCVPRMQQEPPSITATIRCKIIDETRFAVKIGQTVQEQAARYKHIQTVWWFIYHDWLYYLHGKCNFRHFSIWLLGQPDGWQTVLQSPRGALMCSCALVPKRTQTERTEKHLQH